MPGWGAGGSHVTVFAPFFRIPVRTLSPIC